MGNEAKYKTRNYDVGRFKQHGQSGYHFEGDVLYTESSGPYNLEIMRASALALHDILSEAPAPNQRADIAIVTGSILMTPDALEGLRRLVEDLAREGKSPIALALVADPELEGLCVMQKLVASIYADNGIPFRYFEHLADAQAWIAERLAAR